MYFVFDDEAICDDMLLIDSLIEGDLDKGNLVPQNKETSREKKIVLYLLFYIYKYNLT